MAYNEQAWHDKPATDTPINADRLLHIENGIALLDSAVQDLLSRMDTIEGVVYNGDPPPTQSGGGGTGLDTTPPTAPGTPSVTVAADNVTLIVTWTAATDDAGPIAYYHVQSSPDGTTWTDVGTLVDGGTLEYDDAVGATQTRQYQVAAEDQAGNIGPWSPASTPQTTGTGTASTPPTPPGTPTLSASTDTSLTIAWTAGVDNSGSGLNGYRIESSSDGGTTWQYETFWGVSKGLTYTKSGLTSGQQFEFRLKTKDQNGNLSVYSGAGGPFTVPGAPSGGNGSTWTTLVNWDSTDANSGTPMAKWNFYQGWHNQSEGPTDQGLPSIVTESGVPFLRLPMTRKQGWVRTEPNGSTTNGYGWYGCRGDMPGTYGMTTCRVTITQRLSPGALDKNAWMLWPDGGQGPWPESGEWDMQEIFRADRQGMKVTLHDKNSSGKNVQSSATYQMDCTQWHTLRATRIVGDANGNGYSFVVEVDLLDGAGYRTIYSTTDANFVKSTRCHISFAIAYNGGVFNDDNRKASDYDIQSVLVETP